MCIRNVLRDYKLPGFGCWAAVAAGSPGHGMGVAVVMLLVLCSDRDLGRLMYIPIMSRFQHDMVTPHATQPFVNYTRSH